jgi:Trk K+ transport system NAD-binding subunit
VDFDPETVRRLQLRGFSVRFGDGEDAAFLDTLPLTTADWIVTTLPTSEANRTLLQSLKVLKLSGRIAGVVRDEMHRQVLHAAGASEVINPFVDAADFAAQMITDAIKQPEDKP